jgi:hypothetical protein
MDVQTEPGSPPEQVAPSGVLQLTPAELCGFRYLTVSIAPLPVCGSCIICHKQMLGLLVNSSILILMV